MSRYASNYLRLHSGEVLHQQVVELCEGRVVGYSPLTHEAAFTQWLPGTIVLQEKSQEGENILLAYYIGMRTPSFKGEWWIVDETRHKLLR